MRWDPGGKNPSIDFKFHYKLRICKQISNFEKVEALHSGSIRIHGYVSGSQWALVNLFFGQGWSIVALCIVDVVYDFEVGRGHFVIYGCV